MNHSPRASLIGYLYSTLNVLEDLLPIKKHEMQESIEKLHDLKKIIDTNNLTDSNQSLNLSYWIKNIPLIYDPLKVRAEEEVVAKLYDVFMHNLDVFLKDRIEAEDPIAQDLLDKLLGPDGLYQPGLEGYQRLQPDLLMRRHQNP